MKNENYQLDDFLFDESFQRYVIQPTSEDIVQWETWIVENPEAIDYITKAKEIITFIAARRIIPRNQDVSEQVYGRIQQQIFDNKKPDLKPIRRLSEKYYWYAASIILLTVLSISLKVFFRSGSRSVAENFLEVIVPEGQRSQLILPDGTKVWLNAGTQFKYPVDFLEKGREVYVSGEAFFNVKHRNNLPFIVHMKEGLSVRVLGTEFNVKCYPSDKKIETTLVKGSIKLTKNDANNHIIQEVYLKPDQKAVYQKENQKLLVDQLTPSEPERAVNIQRSGTKNSKTVDEIELITAWKNEELIFHDEEFEAIAQRMERWYGMKIKIDDDKLKKERFTGKFVNNETIYQVLDIFNRSESIQYTTKNKEIVIDKRKTNPNP